jgi:NAD+ synthase (glutamine-hydrolysing)
MGANTDRLESAILNAKANGANLFITSELSICGYPPEDLLFRSDFYVEASRMLQRLQAIHGITMLIGCPYRQNEINYNSVFVLSDGQIKARYDKQCLPNYGVFDELRYFTSGNKPLVVEVENTKIGIMICEDMWHREPALLCSGADILCVLNASPFTRNKHQERLGLARMRCAENKLPLIYVNQFGGQDELIFDGASFALNAGGAVTMQLRAYEEKLAYLEYNVAGNLSSTEVNPYPDEIASIYNALVVGVRDYINKNGFKGAVLGLSGGIDSALTLAIAVDALGVDRVMAVMMPSKYTADISVTDSRDMIKRLGVRYEEIAISPIFNQFQVGLKDIFSGLAEDTTEENLQARTRGTLLMAISNKLGFLVLTTGNKSEMTTGYATLYGDMAGGFAVLKDVLKTDVYRLSNYRNIISQVIPQRIITRPPSAELRDNQTDQDSLPDYAILDKIINQMVECGESSASLIEAGFDVDAVNQVARLLKINEYKRRQAAVGPKISKVAYAKDWRYPITNGFKF